MAEAGLCFQSLNIWFEDTVSAKRKFFKMIVANKSKSIQFEEGWKKIF